MVSPTVKLNNRPGGLSAMQQSGHVLVPIDSLTGSPTSSTGSASVLEWNSNSDGELLLSSPSPLLAPLSPPALSPSMVFSLPKAGGPQNDSTQALESALSSLSEVETPDLWTPSSDAFEAPAPMFHHDNTIVVDDESIIGHDTIRAPRNTGVDKLRDLFDLGFWREPLSDFGLPPSSDPTRSPTPSNSSAHDLFASMTNTTVLPPLRNTSSSPEPMAVPIDARGATTSRIRLSSPINESSLPAPFCQRSSGLSLEMLSAEVPRLTPSPFKEVEVTLSYAELLRRNTLFSTERPLMTPESTFRTPRSEVGDLDEVPTPRPPSSNSALSYVTDPNSPASPVHSQMPPSPVPASPSVRSVADQQSLNNDDDLLTFSRALGSPVINRQNPNSRTFWPSSPAVSLPPSSPGERSDIVDLNASSVIGERDPPPPGPYSHSTGTSRSSSPPSLTNAQCEEPLRNAPSVYSNGPIYTASPPWGTTAPDPSVLNIASLLNSTMISEPEERKTPVNLNANADKIPKPFPRSTFSSSSISEQDISYPNIPTWLANFTREPQPSFGGLSNTTTTSRMRPLPRAPKVEDTPQFALRSDTDKPPQFPEDAFYAQPEPSSWTPPSSWNAQTRAVVSPPPPFSPPVTRNRDKFGFLASGTTTNPPVAVRVNRTEFVPPPLPPPLPPRGPPPLLSTYSRIDSRDTGAGLYPPSTLQFPGQVGLPPFYRSPLPGAPYFQPTYTDSTLPSDRRLPPPSSPNWDPSPSHTQSARRLRFAPSASAASTPLTTAPNFRPGPPPAPFIPPYTGLGPTFFNTGYPYPIPAPVIPATPTTYATPNVPLNTFPNLGYPSNRKYWFADATVIFRVEDCLYRVHRHFFDKHSDHISRMLMNYSSYDLTNHIFLPDVKKIEFERLLSIFYPTDLTKPDITTVAGWTSVLGLSQKWQMPQVTALAIQKLTPLTSAVEKLSIARKHNFLPNHEWILPAYIELCSRLSPLTFDEAEELDLATVVKIWEVQHAAHLAMYRRESWSDYRIADMVKEKFGYTNPGYPSWDGGHFY